MNSLTDYLIENENTLNPTEENIFKLICNYIQNNPSNKKESVVQILNLIYFPNSENIKITVKLVDFVANL